LDRTPEEQAILAGSRGEAARRALEYQIEVGRFWGQGRHRRRLGVLRHQVQEDRAEAFIFGVTNPVMVQGAIFAGIPITAGWNPHPRAVVKTGDRVRVDPARRLIEIL